MEIEDEDSFIEMMARVVGTGMPPMAGRIWAYLLICEPAERTAAEIAERLQASRGSVSGMARLLEQVGLVRRRTRPGDRREHFYVPTDAAKRVMDSSLATLRTSREILDAGLALVADRPPESQARLRDLRDVYAFFEREWPALLERLHESEADAPASATRKDGNA